MATRVRHTDEHKRQVVAKLLDGNSTKRRISGEYGITIKQLDAWRMKFQLEELEVLKAENKKLRTRIELLERVVNINKTGKHDKA